MKKCLWAMVTFLIMTIVPFASAAASNPLTIVIDGKVQNYPVAPILDEGAVLAPMRSLWESLGASVKWNGDERSVRAVKGESDVELTIGSVYARVNNEIRRLSLAPVILDGTTMVPLRFVVEALDVRVAWLQEERQVQIYTGQDLKTGTEQNESQLDPLLHYDEGVELALRRSTALRNARHNVVQAEQLRTQLAELRGGFIPLGPGFDQADAADRELLLRFIQADIAWQMARKQVEILEQGIAFQVLTAFQEVLQLEKELPLAGLAVQIAEKQLVHLQKKASLGLDSLFALQNAEKMEREEKLKKEQLEMRVTEAYRSLNALLGLPAEGTPALADDLFTPVIWPAEIQLEQHINMVLSESPDIWMQEQNIYMAQLEVDLYTFNIGAIPYQVKEIDVAKEKNNLNILKQNTDDKLRTLYQQLEQLDIQYSLLQNALSKAAEALRLARVQKEIGLAIELDVQRAELAVAQVETQLQGVLAQYSQVYTLFKKPWLQTGY